MMCRRCVRTVVSATESCSAISWFDRPPPTSVSTLISVSVRVARRRSCSGCGGEASANVSSRRWVTVGGEEHLAVGDDPDGPDELIGANVLEEEAARAGPQRLEGVLVDVERREDQDLDGGRPRTLGSWWPRRRRARASGCPSARRRGGACESARSLPGRPRPRRPTRGRPRPEASSRTRPASEAGRRRRALGSSWQVVVEWQHAATRYPPTASVPLAAQPPKSPTRSCMPRWP